MHQGDSREKQPDDDVDHGKRPEPAIQKIGEGKAKGQKNATPGRCIKDLEASRHMRWVPLGSVVQARRPLHIPLPKVSLEVVTVTDW